LLTVFIADPFYLGYKTKLVVRTILLLTIIVVLFSSCSKFQYYTLSADNLSKNEKQEFIAENDTCRIIYNFYGQKGPIHISIYNKTNKPLQIDWKRSAVIFGDEAVSYFTSDSKIDGVIEKTFYKSSYSSISATVSSPEAIQFLPPRTSVGKQNLFIQTKPGKNITAESRRDIIEMKTAIKKVNKYHFDKNNSPISFRSYITFIMDDNSSFSVDHSFYVTDIFETGAGPDNFPADLGDKFYVRSKSGYGKVSGVVVGIGLLALIYGAAQ